MLKVLVADQNFKANYDCCNYLANDKELNIDTYSSYTGGTTLSKYYEIHPNLLLISSDFIDKSYIDVINELSASSEERNKCNIIVYIPNVKSEIFELNCLAKIYQWKHYAPELSEIKREIVQYNFDKDIFYEPNDTTLRGLFYKLNLNNATLGADYLKYAIKKCYKNPQLLKSLNVVFEMISKEFRIPFESVRPAIRTALKSVRISKQEKKNKGFFCLFETEDDITPKKFIYVITKRYLEKKL